MRRRMPSFAPLVHAHRWTLAATCLVIASGLPACGDDDGGAPPAPDGGEVDGGLVDPPHGMVDPVDMNGPPPPMPPVLVSAMARQVGRFGDDLRIDLVGRDPDGDATTLDVTFGWNVTSQHSSVSVIATPDELIN